MPLNQWTKFSYHGSHCRCSEYTRKIYHSSHCRSPYNRQIEASAFPVLRKHKFQTSYLRYEGGQGHDRTGLGRWTNGLTMWVLLCVRQNRRSIAALVLSVLPKTPVSTTLCSHPQIEFTNKEQEVSKQEQLERHQWWGVTLVSLWHILWWDQLLKKGCIAFLLASSFRHKELFRHQQVGYKVSLFIILQSRKTFPDTLSPFLLVAFSLPLITVERQRLAFQAILPSQSELLMLFDLHSRDPRITFFSDPEKFCLFFFTLGSWEFWVSQPGNPRASFVLGFPGWESKQKLFSSIFCEIIVILSLKCDLLSWIHWHANIAMALNPAECAFMYWRVPCAVLSRNVICGGRICNF